MIWYDTIREEHFLPFMFDIQYVYYFSSRIADDDDGKLAIWLVRFEFQSTL